MAGSSIQSSPDFKSRTSYLLKSSASLSLSSHLNSTLPEISQLSAPSFSSEWDSTSASNASKSSSDRSVRSSKSRTSSHGHKSNTSADVSHIRKGLDTCRLAPAALVKHSSAGRLSDSSRYKSGDIDFSYLNSFDIDSLDHDFDRDLQHLKRDHSRSMFSINSSFHPNFNSTELSMTDRRTGKRVTTDSAAKEEVTVKVDGDLLICGVCKCLFTSLPLFQKHKEKRACRRLSLCHCKE